MCCSVLQPEIVMHDVMPISADIFSERKSLVKPMTQQKTCNYIELFGSSTKIVMHDDAYIGGRSADIQRITLNVSCMTISGGRTKQLDIFCCITGFTSDFLSFIVVELIRFFHGAIQLCPSSIKLFHFTCRNIQAAEPLKRDRH